MKEKFGTISTGTTTKHASAKDGDDNATPKKKGRPAKTVSEKTSAKKRKSSEPDAGDADDDDEIPIKAEDEVSPWLAG